MQRYTPFFLLIALGAALFLAGCSTPGEPEELVYGGNTQPDDDPYVPQVVTGVNVGNEAPDFTLPDTYGDDVVLSDLRGTAVLLYFWATGCVYCEEQHPRMQDFHETYSEDLQVISINIGDDPALVNAYMGEHGLTFPCLVGDAATQTLYNALSVPLALVLDADGLIPFNNHPGYLTEDELREDF